MAVVEHVVLSPLDNVMARYYAKFILFLPVASGQTPKTVYKYLQGAFERTVAEMPFLAGKVAIRAPDKHDSRPGRLEIRIPAHLGPESIPQMQFQDYTDSMDYGDLMDAGVPEMELDGELLLPAAFRPNLEAGADVLVTQATIVNSGCLLGVGIWHSVTDGSGLNTFMKVFADHCRAIQAEEAPYPQLNIPPESFDRGLLTKLWLAEADDSGTPRELDTSECLWRLIGLNTVKGVGSGPEAFAPGAPSSPFSGSTPVMETSIFYVPAKSLADLKKACAIEGHAISANDALMALLWRCIMSARFPIGCDIDVDEETAVLDSTLDGRAQFSTALPPSYMGNVIFISTTSLPLSKLVSPDIELSQIALSIRNSLQEITKQKVHSAYALASSVPDYSQLSWPFATFAGAELCVTSLLNLPFFELNFGKIFGNGGKPECVRPPREEFDAICRRCIILPLQTYGGFEILISLAKDEMERLMFDAQFTEYATFSSH